MPTSNPILDQSFQFAIDIVSFCRMLIERKKEYILSKQLMSSGTSIGANVEEAQSAESKKDFLHKMTIALKEARETRYWLRILSNSGIVPPMDVEDLLNRSSNLIALLVSITKTSKNSLLE